MSYSSGISSRFPFIVKLLIIGTGLVVMARAMSMPFLAIYLQEKLAINPAQIGLLIGSGALIASLSGFFGGWLSDLLGRRTILFLSMLMAVIGFVGFGLAEKAWHFLIFNTIVSLAGSFFQPVAKAAISDHLDSELRLRAFSHRYKAVNIGFALGPLLGAYLGLQENAMAFYVAAAFYTAFLLSLGFYYKFSTSEKQRHVQKKEASTSIDKKMDLKILITDKCLLIFTLGSLVVMAVHGQISVSLAQYLGLNFTEGVQIFAWLMTTNAITVIVTQPYLMRLSEKHEPVWSVKMGALIIALGSICFIVAGSLGTFILSMIIFTIGEVLLVPAEYAMVDAITPESMRGSYYGAHSLCNLGNFIGPWLGGLLLGRYSGGTLMFLTFALLAIVSMLLFMYGFRLQNNRDKQQVVGRSAKLDVL